MGQETFPQVRDGSGDAWGGPGRGWGHFRRSGVCRGNLGEVQDGSGSYPKFRDGLVTVPEVWDGLGNIPEVRDGLG